MKINGVSLTSGLKNNLRLKDFWSKNGGTICIAAGIAGCVGSGVLAARGGIRLKAIIDKKVADIERINKMYEDGATFEDPQTGALVKYDVVRRDADIRQTQLQTIREGATIMMPAVAMAAASVGMICLGVHFDRAMYRSQISNLAAYSATLKQTIDGYRARVAKEVGASKEELLYSGLQKTEETIVETDPETGEVKEVTIEKLVDEMGCPKDGVFRLHYARGMTGWRPNREYNVTTFNQIKSYLDSKLQIRGSATLQDVFDEFGVDPDIRHGFDNIVGQVYSEEEPYFRMRIIDGGAAALDHDPDLWILIETDGVIMNKIDAARRASIGEYKRQLRLREVTTRC